MTSLSSPNDRPARLLARLDEIGAALAATPHGRALIGLGSVGSALDRLDRYSDLDFFAIVADGHKQPYLDDTAWLARPCPLDFIFQNTADGFKYLYADGIFCEMAVFSESELPAAHFAAWRVVWHAPSFDPHEVQPAPPPHLPQPFEWTLGEALTNLYVGLARHRRGEVLSAQRFIQNYAVDRLLELAPRLEAPSAVPADPFNPARRFEQRFPALAARLPDFMPGYGHNVAAARAILDFLNAHFTLNTALRAAIEALLPGD